MKTGLLIVSNLGLDQCLAVSLIIENINHIDALKICARSKGAPIEYDEIDQGSYLNEDDDDTDYRVPKVCFCDEIDLYDTLSKLVRGASIIFLVGYDSSVIKKDILDLFGKNQRVLYTSQFCAADSVAKFMNKNLKRDKNSQIKLAAAHIFYKDYEDISLDHKYLMSDKLRNKGQRIVDYYINSWAIAYNLFFDDLPNLNKFHFEFLSELIFEEPNKFIEKLFSLEIKMEEETKKLVGKEVNQGEGIFLLKTGSQPFFKTEILKDMVDKNYPFSVIEYIKNLEKRIITADFHNNITYEKGPFKKWELLGKN